MKNQTSDFFAENATCEKTEDRKGLLSLQEKINQPLCLPAGIKPYYYDEKAGIVIYNSDCREILPELPKVDLVLTDPPYGIELEYGQYNDTPNNLDSIIKDVFPIIQNKGFRVMLTPGVNNVWKYPPPTWILAWVYGTTNTWGGWGFNSWQPILVYGKDPFLENKMGARMDIISDSHVSRKYNHPCPKPIHFIKKMIERGSVKTTDTILDPFMGSGTTLVAAKQLGRKAIGIEIEEKYCEIAVKRLSQDVLDFGGN